MKTNIREKDNGYVLDMELPGYAKEDIKAELKDGYLTVTATKKSEDPEGTGTCKRRAEDDLHTVTVDH